MLIHSHHPQMLGDRAFVRDEVEGEGDVFHEESSGLSSVTVSSRRMLGRDPHRQVSN